MPAEYLSWVPADVDLNRPNAARVYDYLLGGANNFEVDREFAKKLLTMLPDAQASPSENRGFLRRTVTHLAGRVCASSSTSVRAFPRSATRTRSCRGRPGRPRGLRGHRAGRGGAQRTDPAGQPERRHPARRHPRRRRGAQARRHQIAGGLRRAGGDHGVRVLHFVPDSGTRTPWSAATGTPRRGQLPGLSHGTSDGRPEVGEAVEEYQAPPARSPSQQGGRDEILRRLRAGRAGCRVRQGLAAEIELDVRRHVATYGGLWPAGLTRAVTRTRATGTSCPQELSPVGMTYSCVVR